MDSSYVRLENGKGTLMRCEELKACTENRRNEEGGGTYIKVEGLFSRGGGRILRWKQRG